MPESSKYYEYNTLTGLIVDNTKDLLSDVEQEFKAAYGPNLVVTGDTPQGVQIAAEVTARRNVILNNVALANQINPDVATGVFLDAICSLIGLYRIQAAHTQLTNCKLKGIKDTLVPMGTRVETVIHDHFRLKESVTLDVNGEAFGQFESVEYGEIKCETGVTLTLVDSVLGLESVVNTNEATIGVNQQTNESLRDMRREALSLKSIGTTHAHKSNLLTIDGVRSLTLIDNVTNDPIFVDKIDEKISTPKVEGRSIWVCIDSVTDANKEKVAKALVNSKTAGAGWSGNNEIPFTDPYSNQTYTTKYYNPDLLTCSIKITIIGPYIKETVINKVLEYTNKTYMVGVNVSPFDIAIYLQANNVFISKVEIKNKDDVFTSEVFLVRIFQLAVTKADNIIVIP